MGRVGGEEKIKELQKQVSIYPPILAAREQGIWNGPFSDVLGWVLPFSADVIAWTLRLPTSVTTFPG